MNNYLRLLQKVRKEGVEKQDRTGVGALSLFGEKLKFDLKKGFPLVTTKEVHFKSILHELLWFISGNTNITYLQENGVRIWNEWAEEGELGPVYGHQWRNWNSKGLDQLKAATDTLKVDPDSRRNIVTAWNPEVLSIEGISAQQNVKKGKQALPPCHLLFQFYSGFNVETGKRELSLQMYQRSADLFLGVPFNIASYSLLLMMVAQVTDHDLGTFHHVMGDAHIYVNHLSQVDIQLSREPYKLPTVKINKEIREIDEFEYDDFELDRKSVV